MKGWSKNLGGNYVLSCKLTLGEPELKEEWKHLKSDSLVPALLCGIASPVCAYLMDEFGNKTGSFQGTIVEEIPSSYYIPKGTTAYGSATDDTSKSEFNETICVAGPSVGGDYSLVLVGTDDGQYDLTLAFIYEDGTIDGSAITFDIRKEETHTL